LTSSRHGTSSAESSSCSSDRSVRCRRSASHLFPDVATAAGSRAGVFFASVTAAALSSSRTCSGVVVANRCMARATAVGAAPPGGTRWRRRRNPRRGSRSAASASPPPSSGPAVVIRPLVVRPGDDLGHHGVRQAVAGDELGPSVVHRRQQCLTGGVDRGDTREVHAEDRLPRTPPGRRGGPSGRRPGTRCGATTRPSPRPRSGDRGPTGG
jgi:hypothetical protein